MATAEPTSSGGSLLDNVQGFLSGVGELANTLAESGTKVYSGLNDVAIQRIKLDNARASAGVDESQNARAVADVNGFTFKNPLVVGGAIGLGVLTLVLVLK